MIIERVTRDPDRVGRSERIQIPEEILRKSSVFLHLIKRSLEAGGLMTEKALVHAYACGVLSNSGT
jgi:hypothetical protein